jgi:hypothetical protein
MMYYFNVDFIIYKVSREFGILNERLKYWWTTTFTKRDNDQGYTVIDTDKGDHYLSYDELWEL